MTARSVLSRACSDEVDCEWRMGAQRERFRMARMFWRIAGSFIASVAAAYFACAPAAAQVYPTRPVTIVVPFAAGGANDILARLIAQHMGQALGQQFVIENRGGAGGTIGARTVAKAPGDGYTLMVGHSG